MDISRAWAMPNKNTFAIKPVREVIQKHLHGFSVDPFANTSRVATVTNDIDISCGTDHCMDALSFLGMFGPNSVDTVLFDPPYSPRQISEHYLAAGAAVNKETTRASFWGNLKNEIGRITKPGGTVITCGWNSNGIGKCRDFSQIEILLVAHGAWHNDTIITIEQKAS